MKRDPLQCTRILAFRAADSTDDDGRTLRGYAAVFNQDTVIDSWEGRFNERIDPGAFKKTLRESTPIMQWNHGYDPAVGQIPIGVYKRIEADEHGLDVEGRLHSDPVSERVREAIASGAVTGMSFKFQVIRDEWRDGKGKLIKDKSKLYNLLYNAIDDPEIEMPTRTIKEVRLFEAGPVSTPAYSGTSVGVRSDLTEDEQMAVVSRMLRVSDDDEPDTAATRTESESTAQITQWLAAERDWQCDVTVWLREEALWNEECRQWLEAEAQWRKDSEKPYGDVTYADPGYQKDGKKRYPLDTKDHVKAAWSYINMPKNADKYTASQLSSIKSKIKSAAKKFGITLDTEKKSSDADAAARSTSTTGERTDAAPAGTSVREVNPTTQKGKAMKLEELRARRAAIVARFGEFDTEYRDADMPEDVVTEFDSLTDELRDIDGKIQKIEERQAFMKGIASQGGSQVERNEEKRTPAFHKDRDIHNLDETRMESNSPEDFVYRIQEDAKRFAEKVRLPRSTKAEAARERMLELIEDYDDENGTLAKRYLITGSALYERAFGKAMKACSKDGLTPEEARALSLGGGSPVGEQGGFAVPVQLDPTVILTSPGVIGDIRKYARVETIVGKEWQGVVSNGITVSRDAEAQEVSDDSPELTQPTVKAEAVRGFVPFSMEIDQDWPAMRSEITRMLADAKQREEASAFAVGNGTPPNPQGIVTGATAVALGTGSVTAAGFRGKLPEALYDMETALDPRWRANAVWLGNKSVFNQVRQLDTTTDGRSSANVWERIGAGMPPELIGYPVVENHAMASVYTNGTRILAFGDLSQYLIVDRIGMTVELVPHLIGSNFRPTGQRGIFAIWRNGAKLLIPEAVKVYTTTT